MTAVNNYFDMDDSLIKQDVPEKVTKAIQALAVYYISDEQLKNKGKLLGHYKSTIFFRTYIDIYENAVVGEAEERDSRKAVDFCWGYFSVSRAVVKRNVLYLILFNDTIYRIRHLELAEKIAYIINKQRTIANAKYSKKSEQND